MTILFFGDSHASDLQNYAPLPGCVYAGYPGKRTDELLPILKDTLSLIKPATVVLVAGTNDLEQGRSVDDTANGVRALWDAVSSCQAVVAPLPGSRDNAVVDEGSKAVNHAVCPIPWDSRGEFRDAYHLTPDGVQRLAGTVLGYLGVAVVDPATVTVTPAFPGPRQ